MAPSRCPIVLALNVVIALGANLGDAGDGKLEVAVVAEGAVDQRQQVRVGE